MNLFSQNSEVSRVLLKRPDCGLSIKSSYCLMISQIIVSFPSLHNFISYLLTSIKGGTCDVAMQANFKRGKRPASNRKKPKKRRAITYAEIGSKVMSDISYLKRQFNVEYKYSDRNAQVPVFTNAGSFSLLNGLVVGTSATTRNGQSVKITEVSLHYSIAMAALTAPTAFGRVILLWDQQPNATVFANTDLLVGGFGDVLSEYLVAYDARFTILHDKTYALSQQGTPSLIENFVGYRPHHVEFNTTNAGTIADITIGALFLLVFSDQAANPPVLTYTSRIRYLDN